MIRIDNRDSERRIKNICHIAMQNAGVICGVVVLFAAVFLNVADYNSSLAELVGIIILIISAATLQKRMAESIDFLVSAGAGALAIGLSFALDNGSLFELGGAITLLIAAISFATDKRK